MWDSSFWLKHASADRKTYTPAKIYTCMILFFTNNTCDIDQASQFRLTTLATLFFFDEPKLDFDFFLLFLLILYRFWSFPPGIPCSNKKISRLSNRKIKTLLGNKVGQRNYLRAKIHLWIICESLFEQHMNKLWFCTPNQQNSCHDSIVICTDRL